MQSELDSLKQRVVELLAENAEVKAENAKLRKAMEENEARFVKLEQSDKEKAELIAELNCDVGKIKQEQVAINVSVQDGKSVVKSPTRSELQVTSQSSISPPIEGNSENSSDVTQPTHAGSKSLEDRQTDEFLKFRNSFRGIDNYNFASLQPWDSSCPICDGKHGNYGLHGSWYCKNGNQFPYDPELAKLLSQDKLEYCLTCNTSSNKLKFAIVA